MYKNIVNENVSGENDPNVNVLNANVSSENNPDKNVLSVNVSSENSPDKDVLDVTKLNKILLIESTLHEKKALRKRMRTMRDAMNQEELFGKSNLIFEQLITVPEYKRADRIYTYVSMNSEVDTIMLIDYSLSIDKHVFVPKVMGNNMEFFEISDISELNPGYMGIYEPDTSSREPDNIRNGFMCMPGLAFDRCFNRIGYGGGFYDRYLAGNNSFYKAALAYEFQLVDAISSDSTDIKPDMIVTENEIYRHLSY